MFTHKLESAHVKNEGVLKVTGSRVHFKSSVLKRS